MDALLIVIAATVGTAVAAGSYYAYEALTAPARAVRLRVSPPTATVQTRSPLRSSGGALVSLVRLVPVSAEARERMRVDLVRAGQPFRFEEYIALRVVGAATGVALAIIAQIAVPGLPGWATIPLIAGLGIVGWWLPSLMLSRIRDRRLSQIEKQLPEALTITAKAMRAGSGLLQALSYAADESPDPLGAELRATLRDLQLGADPEEAFEALGARVGSPDLDIAVTAIVIQRTVGGNLSEILGNVSETIRERAQLHAEVAVLTSRQRLTSNLMAAMPVAIGALFIALNPDVGLLLLETTPGRISLAIGLAFEVVGILLIRRLAKIDV